MKIVIRMRLRISVYEVVPSSDDVDGWWSKLVCALECRSDERML